MATATPNLLISFVQPSQNNKENTLNQGLVEFDKAMNGLLSLAMADADVTLTTGEGNQALANAVFVFTGANTAARQVIVPTNKKFYVVSNQTTGGFKITVKTSGGTGVDIKSTDGYIFCYCDGTNVVSAGGSGSGGGGAAGVNKQSTDYTLLTGDAGKNVILTAGSHTFELPATPPSPTWFAYITNENAGVSPGILTIDPNGNNLNGVTSQLFLSQNEGVIIFTDGTNYFYLAGLSSGVPTPEPFALGFFNPGTGSASQKYFRGKLTIPCTFPAGASRSSSCADAAATGTYVITFTKNSTAFATLTWSASGTVGVWAQASDVSFNGTTDELKVDGQSSADGTLADYGFVLSGTR